MAIKDYMQNQKKNAGFKIVCVCVCVCVFLIIYMSITICMTGIISCKIISEPHGKTVKRIDLPRSIFKKYFMGKRLYC